jgi:aspartate dehydrogenase
MNLDALKNARVIFKGGLSEAVEGFPVNINVAAGLFLATKFEKLQIQIVADPETKFNTHEISCSGKFGVITTKTQNLPSRNPKTSQLAILSAQRMLINLASNIHIG